jgi:hypothetical protein
MDSPAMNIVNRGGRPKRVRVEPSELEQLKARAYQWRHGRKIVWYSADMELLYAIADASHGARGAFVRKLARQKRVTETTIWNRISDIEKCVSDVRMTSKTFDSMKSQFAAFNRAFDEAERNHDAAIRLLSRNAKAQSGFGKLDFEAAAWALSKLQSNDISINDHIDIVRALEQIADADENAVFSLKPKTLSPANPM